MALKSKNTNKICTASIKSGKIEEKIKNGGWVEWDLQYRI